MTFASALNVHLSVQNIQKAQNRFEHKTKVAWNPWRPIVVAVLFGLLIVFAIVACCTAISRRFPRTTATFTLLLWLMTAIFFILGSGRTIVFGMIFSSRGCTHQRQLHVPVQEREMQVFCTHMSLYSLIMHFNAYHSWTCCLCCCRRPE